MITFTLYNQTIKEIEVKVAYCLLHNLTLDDNVSRFTTYEKTYCSHFQDEELISEIFSRMLNRVLFAGLMISSEILVNDSPISRRLMALIIIRTYLANELIDE